MAPGVSPFRSRAPGGSDGGDFEMIGSPETPVVFAKVYLLNLERYGISLLCGDIDDAVASQVISELIYLSGRFERAPLLFVSSPGGDFDAALNIIDVMETLPTGVATFVSGSAASAALLVSMAGKKGGRWISPSAQLMSHHYSAGVEGSGKEIKAERKRMDYLNKLMESMYEKHTGLSVRTIRTLLKTESAWINPKEAVSKYRMADHVGTEILREYLGCSP